MRCDQHAGLTEMARALVAGCGKPHFTGKHKLVKVVIADSHKTREVKSPVLEPCVRQEPSGKVYLGMFGDEYPLHMYTLRSGRVYYERVQADPWSSGPVFFLALTDEDGNWIPETLWPEEAINNA